MSTTNQDYQQRSEYIRKRVRYIVQEKLSAHLQQPEQVILSERFPHLLHCKAPSSDSQDRNLDLEKYIDHTLLKAHASRADVTKLSQEAMQYSFAAICVNGSRVQLARQHLQEKQRSDIGIACVIGFPLGAMSTAAKLAEAKDALDNGATELDMVLNIGQFLDEDYAEVLHDIEALAKECHSRSPRAKLKVILETCLLKEDTTERCVVDACILCVLARADFVKTSTGFSTGGAKISTVALMKHVVGDSAKVKASGGIRNAEDTRAYVHAGADRIGTSSGVAICSNRQPHQPPEQQPSTY